MLTPLSIRPTRSRARSCVAAAALAIISIATSAAAQSRPSVTTGPQQLVGTWRLIALDEQQPNGQMHHCDCSGMFVFTSDGHAAVQVMSRNAQAGAGSGYSQGGYEASFGSYVVDEQTHTFTFHIQGALVRSLIGKDLPRRYELSGNRLVVRPTSTEEHWSVTWERY
jgi:lipocalin-like protein